MPYQNRLKKLQQSLQEKGCDALLVEDKINLFYLTGLDLSAGKLLVQPHTAHLFVDGRYFESCQKNCPFPVQEIDPPSLENLFAFPECTSIKILGFDSEKTSFKTYQQLAALADKLKHSFKLIPVDSPLQALRAIKDESEIDILRKAAALGSEGFDHICTLLRENISEMELATELEIFWKKRGAKTVAFDPIIAFGPNSSMPHYRAGSAKLRPGQIVLIDIGVNFHHYHSDMTRVVFFGEPDQRLKKIHGIVQRAQQAALTLCRPGITLGTLDTAARSLITENGYGQNFTHSLGHGVGLEIHEFPTIRNTPSLASVKLAPGMVITIEPGIYLPGIGGVRIEDTVVITKNGCENLTQRSTDIAL